MLRKLVLNSYDIRADDASLRKLLALPREEQPAYFDRLRKEYPVRRESSASSVLVDDAACECESLLRGLGFPVVVTA